MEIKVPDDLQQQIAKALLDSVIGDALRKSVDETTKSIVEGKWDSPVKRAITQMSEAIIKEMLDTPGTRVQIKAAIMLAFQDVELVKKLLVATFTKDT